LGGVREKDAGGKPNAVAKFGFDLNLLDRVNRRDDFLPGMFDVQPRENQVKSDNWLQFSIDVAPLLDTTPPGCSITKSAC
jgi:hypothetical protein